MIPDGKLAGLRMMRDRALRESDALMLPDYPLTDEQRAAVLAYREALRHITQQDDPVLPECPVPLPRRAR